MSPQLSSKQRICKRCKEPKTDADFRECNQATCRRCLNAGTSARGKGRYQNDPEYRARRLASWRKSYKKCKHQWPSQSRDRINAYHRKRRADPATNEKILGWQAEYKERHRLRCLVRIAIKRAKDSGMEYDEEFMRELGESEHPKLCACCQAELNYSTRDAKRGHRPHPRCPSLDRVDSTEGYIESNVQVICWRCNAIKRDATAAELEDIAAYMRRHLG